MRMKQIPRALPTERNVAEAIELGSGMSDRRVTHTSPGPISYVENDKERAWFNEAEKADPDPRFARSDYHDPALNIMMDKKAKTSMEDVELAEGIIKDAIMYPNGAHIELIDGEDIYFIFAPETNFVVKGTRVKIVDRVTIITHPYPVFPGSDELAQEEKHSLIILEILEDTETESNEIEEEE